MPLKTLQAYNEALAAPAWVEKEYSADRLAPLEHLSVDTGCREGRDNNVIHRPEASAIVDKIALSQDKRYDDKTMGVCGVARSGTR